MSRRHVLPALVLLAIWGLSELLPAVGPPAVPVDLELSSERIGWTAALESDHIARDIFERVNDERGARGLSALVWDEGLADLSRRWSEEMIVTGFRHSTDEFRAHPAFVWTGENIHMGSPSASTAHVGWMESDGHRNNLLAPQHTAIGIGVVCRNDGRMWSTQILGTPHGVQPALASTPVEPIVRRDDGPACPLAERRWGG